MPADLPLVARSILAATAAALWIGAAQPAVAQGDAAGRNTASKDAFKPIDVAVINRTTPTPCAEKDNVHVDFQSADIARFEILAEHPAYIASVKNEKAAFDLTGCSFSKDPTFPTVPRKKTFWETPEFWLVGHTFSAFWRPNDVAFRVGDRIEKGFHLVQLWMLYRERAEEILVVYPPDGYWRARPLPHADMRWTAYGTSFLAGPVETEGRPIVRLKEISFDPDSRTFTMHYARGGTGKLRLVSIDQKQIRLSVSFSGDIPRDRPFATLRSMFVTENNSDVARLSWRRLNGEGGTESLITDFKQTMAAHVWAGRRIMSRHNLSAPDHVFRAFSASR